MRDSHLGTVSVWPITSAQPVERWERSARQFAVGNAAARTMFKAVLRCANAVPAVKRAMFSGHGAD